MLLPSEVVERPDRSERVLGVLGVVLAAVMVAMSLVPGETTPARDFDPFAGVVLAVAYGSLVLLRRWPIVALAVALLSCAVWFPRGYAGAWPAPALLVAIFVIARDASNRRVLVAALGVIAISASSMLVGGLDSFVTAVGILGWMAAAALLGDVVRQRRLLEASYRNQLKVIAAEQRAESDRRVAEERVRIARDLHDVLAHAIAAIGLHAGAASDLLEPTEPAAQRIALVRRCVATAVDDVRRSIGTLRTSDSDDSADEVAGWGALPGLLAEARAAGTQVSLETDVDVSQLPELIGVCVYRLVQEGITNIRRHSQASSAQLILIGAGDDLVVTLEDPGPRRLPARPTGFGLVGMNERVHTAGGTLACGPTSLGGFRVVATFPRRTVST